VSVQEIYAVHVDGFTHGFAAAERLSARAGAVLRWAALWIDPTGPDLENRRSALAARFGPHLTTLAAAEVDTRALCLTSPTPAQAQALVAHAAELPVVVHWSPALYVGEEGPEAPWISFVDGSGSIRDDARLYRIELAGNAVPLTAGDRPEDGSFVYGPQVGSGWELRLVAIRDHMPRGELVQWLAEAMSVPATTIRPVT